MAFDISKLAHLYDFDYEMESLGKLHCRSLTSEQESELTKTAGDPNVSGESLARQLLDRISYMDAQPGGATGQLANEIQLSAEDVRRVTISDLESFCRQFLLINKRLLSAHGGGELQYGEGESALDFLKRALLHRAGERKAQMERMMTSMSGSLFADTTLESMRQNSGLSDRLQNTIDEYTRGLLTIGPSLISQTYPIPELHIPKNPIHETNKKLESVVKQIEELRPMAAQAAELIRSMNDTALRMQADYIQNAKAAGRQTRYAIWIAAVSLFVSAIGLAISSFFSYLSYVDAKESGGRSDAQIKAFQNEIRDLATAQREERSALVYAIVNSPRVSAKADKK